MDIDLKSTEATWSGNTCSDSKLFLEFSSYTENETSVCDQVPKDNSTIVHTMVYTDIIHGREILKESDEYNHAAQKEWAARRLQIQIQAEEAKRLKRGRKAERSLLDSEKRQKQRVKEVRETLRKDEENLETKENLRGEVMKELSNLETTCIDMASLLNGLGFNVGSGLNPLSKEIHTAYKHDLLKFHPDKASRSDIRQQVEFEEKFKLICRMKDKRN